ncbi:MAG: metallophosphoesterase family protein [Chloroflexota bacterium]
MKILHFADAHIDMANYGRHDPQTGLPLRVMDFLKSLDTIVDAAIREKVDLVVFAGDAYRDRSPAPTFQREWGRRVMRLSQAGIPTLLLVGNHDLSPAIGRAHAIEEFATLQVPHVRVLDRPCFIGPDELEGLPLQIIALPWINRLGRLLAEDDTDTDVEKRLKDVDEMIGEAAHRFVDKCLTQANPSIPIVLIAHASVQGAKYGGERAVMLGGDFFLPPSLVKDPRLDYVALGHIHKPQNLNEGAHPPVVYPGSIERVDFGEAAEERFFVTAQVSRGKTDVTWHRLAGVRPFFDHLVHLRSAEDVTKRLIAALPPPEALEGAIVRLVIEYPRSWGDLIDEAALRQHTAGTFEFHLVKRPQTEKRARLPEDKLAGSLSPLELLHFYWDAAGNKKEEKTLQTLAAQVIAEVENGQAEG